MNENVSPDILFKIAAAIPEAHVAVDRPNKILIGSRGAGVHIGTQRDQSQYHITVYWPSDKKGNYYRPSEYNAEEKAVRREINVSTRKTPGKIASEINQRLMPSYLPLFNKLKDQADASDNYSNESVQSCERFAAGVGMDYTPSRHGLRPSLSFYNNDRLGYVNGSAEFQGTEVHLDLRNVSVDDALKIAALLRESKKEGA